MEDTCKFSTYGYACGKPVEHGRYLCEEHAKAKCSSCGQTATHGCDFCGQFVCGAPLCDECTYGTDDSKPSGAWGFMNHLHISKPEFADKHEDARLNAALSSKDAELSALAAENARLRGRLDSGPHGEDAIDVAESAMGHLRHRIETLEAALQPFVNDWADENGWTDVSCQKDRVVDWFGPSDFYRARAALEQKP